ncbi:hypothetical protein L207DRAFT_568237 [Hyaloscypha variabilis F]|uniref:BZIP domain-containing protein n=1 Tax=Hyaloscypha variabilis (strain UAMH 11265 / GT02V1 / F) TaxID=1149755 RepID=A0A2J6RF90_HYAVF|nr:hypothetical protein L207DRAFT_568237 [Hyaloscypha variabilis F]
MTDSYGQSSGWDAQPASFQYPAVTQASNDYQMNIQPMSPNPHLWAGYTPSQHMWSPNAQNVGTVTAPGPSGTQLSPAAGINFSQLPESAILASGQDTHRHRSGQISRSPPSADKSERRRQQNRTSQFAFRQRNKMTLLTLQEELDQSLLVNETLYSTIEALLEKTEDLKRCIEEVLAARLKRGRSESYNSPRSSSSLPIYSSGRRG